MKIPVIASAFCQVAWVVRDLVAAEKFFVETMGISRFMHMEHRSGVGSCIVRDGIIRFDLLSLPQRTHDCQPVFSSPRCTFGCDSRCDASATV